MIRGIGPVYAKKLVRAFGESVFEVIHQEPGRLREVTGIGPKRAERIIAGWAEQKVIRDIMLFLHSNGVGTSRAVRIYKTYGADAVRLVSENPYRLARDIRGIGFRTADQIAAKLGIEKTALMRIRAGISFALSEAMDDGHCGLPHEELLALTRELLEVPAELVVTALGLELQDGAVIADDLDDRCCVFLAGLYRAEREARSCGHWPPGTHLGPQSMPTRLSPGSKSGNRGARTFVADREVRPTTADDCADATLVQIQRYATGDPDPSLIPQGHGGLRRPGAFSCATI